MALREPLQPGAGGAQLGGNRGTCTARTLPARCALLGHGVNLGEVIDKITATECKRLAKAGDNFNVLKKRKVSQTASL
jgi:hypothetical protein